MQFCHQSRQNAGGNALIWDEGSLQRQVLLRMHACPFMDEVVIEDVDQRDVGNRGSGCVH